MDARREMMQAWADYLYTLRLAQSQNVRLLRSASPRRRQWRPENTSPPRQHRVCQWHRHGQDPSGHGAGTPSRLARQSCPLPQRRGSGQPARHQREGHAGHLAPRLLYHDTIVLDELGYMPFAQDGGAMLFHLINKLYNRVADRHHQPDLRRVEQRVRRCQDDHRASRSDHLSVRHRRNRQQQLPVQETQLKCSTPITPKLGLAPSYAVGLNPNPEPPAADAADRTASSRMHETKSETVMQPTPSSILDADRWSMLSAG